MHGFYLVMILALLSSEDSVGGGGGGGGGESYSKKILYGEVPGRFGKPLTFPYTIDRKGNASILTENGTPATCLQKDYCISYL